MKAAFIVEEFFPVFQYGRLKTQNLTKILISKALMGILIHMTVCHLEDLGNKPRLLSKPPCSYFRHEKMEQYKETV